MHCFISKKCIVQIIVYNVSTHTTNTPGMRNARKKLIAFLFPLCSAIPLLDSRSLVLLLVWTAFLRISGSVSLEVSVRSEICLHRKWHYCK